jgi:hypothetical protein
MGKAVEHKFIGYSQTDGEQAAAWGEYRILGRVRLVDGLIVMVRNFVSGRPALTHLGKPEIYSGRRFINLYIDEGIWYVLGYPSSEVYPDLTSGFASNLHTKSRRPNEGYI